MGKTKTPPPTVLQVEHCIQVCDCAGCRAARQRKRAIAKLPKEIREKVLTRISYVDSALFQVDNDLWGKETQGRHEFPAPSPAIAIHVLEDVSWCTCHPCWTLRALLLEMLKRPPEKQDPSASHTETLRKLVLSLLEEKPKRARQRKVPQKESGQGA